MKKLNKNHNAFDNSVESYVACYCEACYCTCDCNNGCGIGLGPSTTPMYQAHNGTSDGVGYGSIIASENVAGTF